MVCLLPLCLRFSPFSWTSTNLPPPPMSSPQKGVRPYSYLSALLSITRCPQPCSSLPTIWVEFTPHTGLFPSRLHLHFRIPTPLFPPPVLKQPRRLTAYTSRSSFVVRTRPSFFLSCFSSRSSPCENLSPTPSFHGERI